MPETTISFKQIPLDMGYYRLGSPRGRGFGMALAPAHVRDDRVALMDRRDGVFGPKDLS